MDLSANLFWFALGAAVMLLVLLGFIVGTRLEERGVALREVRQRFHGQESVALCPAAFFYGFGRPWDRAWRGRGVLLLTLEMLYYRSWQRRLDLCIPLEAVVAATAGTHRSRPCLEVRYRAEDRELRTATWSVTHPGQWADALNTLLEKDLHGRKTEAKHLPQNEDPRRGASALG